MYKKMTALLLVVCMTVMMAGCSMFTSGDGGAQKAKGGEPVKITDEYAHEDPADLDFDERVVLHVPEGGGYFQMVEEQAGVSPTAAYVIIYGKEDKPVAYYEYMALSDEEQVETYKQFCAAGGLELVSEGTVTYFEKHGDAVDADVAQFIAWGSITEGTMEQFVNCWCEMYEATIVE